MKKEFVVLLVSWEFSISPAVANDVAPWAISRDIAFPTVLSVAAVYVVTTLILLVITITKVYSKCGPKRPPSLRENFVFVNNNVDPDSPTTPGYPSSINLESTFTIPNLVPTPSKGTLNTESATSNPLKPDAFILFYYVNSIADKWPRIGEELGVDLQTISAIKAQKKKDNKARLKDLCKTWINSTPQCSWTDVINALKRCDEPELAKKVATHCGQ